MDKLYKVIKLGGTKLSRVRRSSARVRRSSAACVVRQQGCGVAHLGCGVAQLGCGCGVAQLMVRPWGADSAVGTPGRFFPLSIRAMGRLRNLGNRRRMNMTGWMCVKNVKINEQKKSGVLPSKLRNKKEPRCFTCKLVKSDVDLLPKLSTACLKYIHRPITFDSPADISKNFYSTFF